MSKATLRPELTTTTESYSARQFVDFECCENKYGTNNRAEQDSAAHFSSDKCALVKSRQDNYDTFVDINVNIYANAKLTFMLNSLISIW